MQADPSSVDPNRLAKRNLVVLVAAQGILGAQMPMIFSVSTLAGAMLTPNPCFATLPISCTVLGSMLTATPISAFMQRYGRAAGFVVGALGGALGGALAVMALLWGSFTLLCLGALCTGIYMSAQGFYRFAAADTATEDFRAKAISWVMAGGLLSAIFGPQLVNLTSDIYVVTFAGTYAAIVAINLLGMFIFAALKIPPVPRQSRNDFNRRSRREMLANPQIWVAIACAAVSYALMNLVMTSAPLAIVGCGFDKSEAPKVISAHVLAMYVPSFFTGNIIVRFGCEKVIALGLTILAVAGAVAMSGVELSNFYLALILLGIGWNFGFIGSTTMLTNAQNPQDRGLLQGLNDMIVFGGVTFASVFSGGLLNCGASSTQTGWQLVNMAMFPLLILAGGALIWLWLRPQESQIK